MILFCRTTILNLSPKFQTLAATAAIARVPPLFSLFGCQELRGTCRETRTSETVRQHFSYARSLITYASQSKGDSANWLCCAIFCGGRGRSGQCGMD